MAEEDPPSVSGEEDSINSAASSSPTGARAADASSAAAEPLIDAGVAVAPDMDVSTDEQKAIDDLLKQATFEDPQAVAQALPATSNLDLPTFNQIAQEATTSSIDLLRDVDLNVKIELGRSQMLVEDVLKLGEGSVVELDKLAGDPVDVFVNERLVARGEVLVLNDNFCVRINEIVSGVKEEGL